VIDEVRRLFRDHVGTNECVEKALSPVSHESVFEGSTTSQGEN